VLFQTKTSGPSSPWLLTIFLFLMSATAAHAQSGEKTISDPCDFSDVPGAIWWGTDSIMSLQDFVSHAAPVFWFSPDEPSLGGQHGQDMIAPEAFPFETADGPVVYYQLKKILQRAGDVDTTSVVAFELNETDKGASLIHLDRAVLLRLDFYAYFSEEAGLGAHQHDVEPVEFKMVVMRSDELGGLDEYDHPDCTERHYVIAVTRVTGKAHGIEWYWNIVDVDGETKFPMTLLVEEGKHALATDKNGDGYFTPSYDVNVRINDAWGVRDIIRSGGLFSGGYQAWMTKVRHPRDRVLPPLPEGSPLQGRLTERQLEFGTENVTYELRKLPQTRVAIEYDLEQGGDSHLEGFLSDKEVPNWPSLEEVKSRDDAVNWIDAGALKRSLSIAYYSDGDGGISWVFPFWIVKNLDVSMSGGYLLHRMYLKDEDFRDFGWMALYTNSASRWIDPYFAAGVEWHTQPVDGVDIRRTDFVLETGIKFRAQIGRSPLRFLSVLTDFWGFRFGVKNYGFQNIDHLTYVFEIGAGSF